MIVTPYSHILRNKMLHFAWQSISVYAQLVGGSFKQHAEYEDIESSENLFNIETVLRYSGMFQGRDNV